MIFRAGVPMPIPEVSAALRPHINSPDAKAFPVPGGVVSIIDTESSIADVSAALDQVGVFFFIVPMDANVVGMPQGLNDALNQRGIVAPSAPQPVRPLTVDEILDKINATGVESLTDAERAILEANQTGSAN